MSFRLLISGSKRNTNTLGSFIIQNFEPSLVYEVLDFPDRFAELMELKFYRLIYRLFPILIVRSMDRLFLAQAARFNPTVVLIFKGMEISKWSLQRLSAKGIKLVNYNLDHPFEFFSRGTGNRFVLDAIPYYDLHISYSAQIATQLAALFHVKTAQLPFGFHLTSAQYETIRAADATEINRACFVGNPDSLRIETIKKLLANGIAIDLYGFGWEKIFTEVSPLLIIHLPRKVGSFWADPLEFWKVLRQYRIQLNFFRPHNEGSHNLRTFEVPAVGGILLTPASDEQAKFFVPSTELFFYRDHAELVEKCHYLLQLDQRAAGAIRDAARAKSIKADYSYARRTKDLLALLPQ